MSLILNHINYFWKLGYNEKILNRYIKEYANSYCVTLNIDNETIDYGDSIQLNDKELGEFSQKNFVVLECVDRLLGKGYSPSMQNR